MDKAGTLGQGVYDHMRLQVIEQARLKRTNAQKVMARTCALCHLSRHLFTHGHRRHTHTLTFVQARVRYAKGTFVIVRSVVLPVTLRLLQTAVLACCVVSEDVLSKTHKIHVQVLRGREGSRVASGACCTVAHKDVQLHLQDESDLDEAYALLHKDVEEEEETESEDEDAGASE